MKLWIARQQDKSVYLFTHKPTLFCGRWCMNGVRQCYTKFWENRVECDLFPEVTFENSPQQIELKLVNNTTNGFAEDLLINCIPLEGEFSKFVDDNFEHLI